MQDLAASSLRIAVPDWLGWLAEELFPSAPGAMIAGGVLRDLAAGVAPRDVDIYLCPGDILPENWILPVTGEVHATARARWEIRDVQTVTGTISPIPVQVVWLRRPLDPEVLMSRFDFRACRAAWGAKGMVFGEGFAEDLHHQRLSWVSGAAWASEAKSRARAAKILARYPAEWRAEFGDDQAASGRGV